MKSIIKEVFIIILMIIAIVLIMGIIFYDKNPSQKKIPSKVEAYTLPEEMKEELEETLLESEKQDIVKTYRVTADDLNVYVRSDDYQKGKKNPFADVNQFGDTTSDENTSSAPNGSSSSTSNNSSTSSSSSTSQGNTSQGRFLDGTGK